MIIRQVLLVMMIICMILPQPDEVLAEESGKIIDK